jgi:hypothetical protein
LLRKRGPLLKVNEKPTIVERLMRNYVQACRRRLALWVSPNVEVELADGCSMEIRLGERKARLEFEPRTCDWTLEVSGEHLCGNFDRMTKRLRQTFTSSPL